MNAAKPQREARSFASRPASCRAVRLFVGDFLRAHGASDTTIKDYQLVVSELAANVVEHGNGSEMTVVVDVGDPLWWDVHVTDGPAFSRSQLLRPHAWAVAHPSQISGRGLGIIRQLMDDIAVINTDGHVSVRSRRRR